MVPSPQPVSATHSNRAGIVLAFAAVYLIWGSTYLAIRYAVETIPPFFMAGCRFLTAGALLYLWTRAGGAARPSRREWAWRGSYWSPAPGERERGIVLVGTARAFGPRGFAAGGHPHLDGSAR